MRINSIVKTLAIFQFFFHPHPTTTYHQGVKFFCYPKFLNQGDRYVVELFRCVFLPFSFFRLCLNAYLPYLWTNALWIHLFQVSCILFTNSKNEPSLRLFFFA